jgi:hypothetical protein
VLSGKVIAAVVAAAVSSASAATVGVVYKKMVEPKPVEASAPVGVMVASGGPVRSAVVLNASDSLFGFLAGSTGEGDSSADSTTGEGDATCRGRDGCVLVARTSDRRVNILGSAATMPFWLGGDSRDVYAYPAAGDFLSFGEPERVVVHLAHRRPKTGTLGLEPQSDQGSAQNGNGDPSGSGGESPSSVSELSQSSPTRSSAGLGYPIDIGGLPAPSGISSFKEGSSSPVDLLPALLPIGMTSDPAPSFDPLPDQPLWQISDPVYSPPTTDSTPVPPIDLLPSGGGLSTPEPSTWIMMIAGVATLGLFKRRRLAVALRAMRC